MINATLRLTRTADDGAEMFRKYYLVGARPEILSTVGVGDTANSLYF